MSYTCCCFSCIIDIEVNVYENGRQVKSVTSEEIKRETIKLYDKLPMELEARKASYDIRDQILELNYKFFGYVASHKFVNNTYISYEDKLNGAICAWLTMWWKYRWTPKYRADLSFSVFFRPRITEMMEREFDEVKYSVRRSLLMEVGKQLNKMWSTVTYEDLSNPNLHLPSDTMASLKALFGSLYPADLETHGIFLESTESQEIEDYMSDDYDSVEDFLIHEMVTEEQRLSDAKLKELSDTYCLDYWELKKKLPDAENKLYKKLHRNLELHESI